MRYRAYLQQRYKLIFSTTGGILVLIGLTMLLPLLALPAYPSEITFVPSLLLGALPLIGGGLALWWRLRPASDDPVTLSLQEGMVIVVLTWLVALLFGALPLWVGTEMSFTHALFESVSGWTTTGLTVLADIDDAPRLVLLYRSCLQLVGGVGFVIIILNAITGPTGTGLIMAEGREDQLVPNVRRSALMVVRFYLVFVTIGVLLLWLAGMTPFDAVNHAFAAASTGGFSTHAASIGFYDSGWVEAATILIMLSGMINYATLYAMFQGKWQAVWRNGELRMTALQWPLAALLVGVAVASLYPTLGKGVRVALFETISAISTCGLGTVSYNTWPDFAWLVVILLMIIGGGIGSTAGGLKQIRVYVLYKALRWEIVRSFLPEHTVNEPEVWRGDKRAFLNDRQVRQVALFVFLYFTLLLLGALVLTGLGYDLGSSFFEMASALSGVGMSVGVTSPDAHPATLWTLMLGMFLGRLEFLAIFIGAAKLIADGTQLAQRQPAPA